MQPTSGAGHYGPVPGQTKQPVLSEAQRGAEALFTTKTITEIREIEVRTRKDIEQKKLQLRNLVGDSYRDLIDSADKILAISNNTTTILTNIRSIQESFTSLAHNFTSSDALLNEKRDSLTKHEELYAVGSRVKYLIDTPELIWGCLDAAHYLDAARRFLRAQHVHELLPTAFAPAVLDKFPLLKHHWPTVTKFKKQVVDAVGGALSRERQLPTELAADMLAALASLREMDAASSMQVFLSSRRTLIAQIVATAAAAPEPLSAAAAAEVLSAVAQTAQHTVAQVGELFLPSNRGGSAAAAAAAAGGSGGADASCLLQQRCREDEADYSELLFGGRTTSGAGGAAAAAAAAAAAPQAPEADAWRRTNRAVVDRLAALSSGQVEQACVQWLRAVAEDFSGQSPKLLVGLTTAAALVEVEAQVRGAIACWQHPGLAAATAPAAAAKRPRIAYHASASALLSMPSSSSAAAGGGAGSAGSAGAEAPQLDSWESVCEWVVGRQLNLWQEVFHQPFVVRSKELIEESYAAVGRALEGPLDACLRAAAAADPEPAGCIITRVWPLEGWDVEGGAAAGAGGADGRGAGSRTTSISRSMDLRAAMSAAAADLVAKGADGSDAEGDGAAAADRSYRQHVSAIQRRFDEDLRSILQAALLLVGSADAACWPAGVHSTPVSASPSHASLALSRAASEAQTGGAGAAPLPWASPHGASHLHARSSLHTLASIKRDMQGSRAAELEPFVQSKCMELVAGIAAMLQSRLQRLGSPRAGPSGAPTAEQVVLLGRLASALAADSRYLPVVLGAPEGWKAAVAGGGPAHAGSAAGGGSARALGRTGPGAAGRVGAGAAAANARLCGVLEQLRSAAVCAYRCWAGWAAGSLAGELRALLLADELLTTNTVPLSWQETVIRSEADNALAEPVEDMRFSLPASPSPAVLLLLSAACAEVRRAGDYKIAPEALQAFEWELSRSVTAVYSQLLQPGTGQLHVRGLSEKGILQLLFDVRFVRDVLLGGRPVGAAGAGATAGGAAARAGTVSSGSSNSLLGRGLGVGGGGVGAELADPAVVSALAERKREGAALEQMLQDCLDPIDWATYESYLWANEARYFQRVAILLGGLVQLQRAHPEGATKLAASGLQDSNPLNVLPVAPRFHYLPISAPAPSAAAHQAATAAAAAVMGAGVVAGAAGGAGVGAGGGGGGGGVAGSLAAAYRLRPSMGALCNRAAPVSVQSGADAADSYSFADLGAARLGSSRAGVPASKTAAGGSKAGPVDGSSSSAASAAAAGGAAAQLGGSAAAVGAAALSALQARLQGGSLGTFGSLLGDKAAEVTAMAQQRFGEFGDYLPTSALGSAGGLLSSLAKNVVKK
ncbi:hypothetical protein Agub_g5608 [Astrephomene gubernaculifera]|uniref:Conserved oligomeric Golgi complex subunit 1 n=1 Tax=Astrephomene gubernaculifera TaxID=47775 RepID=A0AAD3HKU2_9CHLO|nr:hypothetical protein Agub_g5608 [Astrephomene gubernaculifera]